MTDARFPDRWLNDRRIMGLSPGTFRVFVLALAWSAANRTDGVITDADRELMPWADPRCIVDLVVCGLWEREPDYWLISVYEETQSTAAELAAVDVARHKARDKKRRQRAKSGAVPGDVSGDVLRDYTGQGQGQGQGQAQAPRSEGLGKGAHANQPALAGVPGALRRPRTPAPGPQPEKPTPARSRRGTCSPAISSVPGNPSPPPPVSNGRGQGSDGADGDQAKTMLGHSPQPVQTVSRTRETRRS